MLICARFSITYLIGRSGGTAPRLRRLVLCVRGDGVPSQLVCAAVVQEGGIQNALQAESDQTK